MPASVIEIKGLETVVNELKRRNLDVRAGLETICNAGADVVLTDAKRVRRTMWQTTWASERHPAAPCAWW